MGEIKKHERVSGCSLPKRASIVVVSLLSGPKLKWESKLEDEMPAYETFVDLSNFEIILVCLDEECFQKNLLYL